MLRCDLVRLERVVNMTMTGSVVGGILKELRGEETQQQFSFDLGVARETLSKYENGRTKVPSDISRSIVKKFDDPKFAVTVQHEYTGTGPRYLDGPNVDLHRCSVKEKTIEELQEVLDSMKCTNLTKPAKAINPFERQNIENMVEEAVEAITALTNFVAVATQHFELSYTGVWLNHYKDLEKAGYISNSK